MKVQKLSYREYWGYYWRVTHRHKAPGIFDWDESLVKLIESVCALKPGADILDLGCAGGDQSRLFARKGYHVFGIDMVPRLIEYARKTFQAEGLQGKFAIGDLRTIDFSGEFDLCLLLGGTFGFPSQSQNMSLLKSLHRSLRAAGKVYLDYLPVEYHCRMPHSKTWSEMDNGYALEEQWYDVVNSTYRTRHIHLLMDGRIIQAANEEYSADERIRCFTASEIEHLSMGAGFRVHAHLCGKNIRNPDYVPEDSEPRGILVLEKPE